MGASVQTARTQGRPQVPAPPRSRGTSPRGRLASGLVRCLLVAVLASCDGDRSDAAPLPTLTAVPVPSSFGPSASPSPSASPTPDEQAELLSQYRKFWLSLTPVSRMPAAQRRAALAPVAEDPALKSLLAGMQANDRAGEVFYGAHVPHPKPVPISPDGRTALVDDCQDSRHTGLADKSSLKPKTQGVARNHVSVTMKRSPGSSWKVAFVAYTKTPC